jgi:hypothetical protein
MRTLIQLQTMIVVLAVVVAVVILASRGEVNGDNAVIGLISLAASMLGGKVAIAGINTPTPPPTNTEPHL